MAVSLLHKEERFPSKTGRVQMLAIKGFKLEIKLF
ncbi:hypothetical protein CCACVL1_05652 [Corchorus capsularis]|uniref:Uncharacterized protein n=1 Tax=Corchorus capsularis TaxID=210143 RepID=A0A1R3JJP7_COCAP|nr:hypothetical protein CCACVL1_05652 [Corchorus capsularis]